MNAIAKNQKNLNRKSGKSAKSAKSRSMPPSVIQDSKKLIASFMSSSDAPAWFRGISDRQMDAAENLWNGIRDDTEQGTAHRVRACLWSIGIHPLVNTKETKFLMKLSKGNDLAFLWFLMEIHYKTPGEEKYSINEQLILTSIMHLDMVTTLRELDRIMPPGHESKRMIEQRQRQHRITQSRNTQLRIKRSLTLATKHSNPYFNKLERPVVYGRPLAVDIPDFKVNLSLYEKANDSNYVPPSETNRWYVKYPLQKSNRIVHSLIKKCVSDVITVLPSTFSSQATAEMDEETEQHESNAQAAEGNDEKKRNDEKDWNAQKQQNGKVQTQQNAKDKHKERMAPTSGKKPVERRKQKKPKKQKWRMNQMDDNLQNRKEQQNKQKLLREQNRQKLKSIKDRKVLCSHHQVEDQQRRMKEITSMLDKRNKFMKSIDANSRKRQLHLKRVMGGLDKEINQYRLHYQQQRREHSDSKSYVRVLCKDNSYCAFHVNDSAERTCERVINNAADEAGYDMEFTSSPYMMEYNQIPARKFSTVSIEVNAGRDKYNQTPARKHSTVSIEVIAGRDKRPGRWRELEASSQLESELIFSHKNRLSFNENKHVLPTAGTNMSGYFENFDRGYSLATPNSSQRFFEAPTPHKPYRFNYEKVFHYKYDGNMNFTIKKFCTKALDANVHKAQKLADFTPNLAAVAEQCANDAWLDAAQKYRMPSEHLPKHPVDPYPPEMPRLEFYDCEDEKLMNEMLRIALEHMRKDPKYVLASLPNAHKLQLLREWVYQRYGKRYTNSQRLASFNESLKILKAVIVKRVATKLPVNTMGRNQFVNYSCFPYVLRKTRKLKDTYYNNVKEIIMEQCRVFWFAMRPHLCTGGQTHSTFFSYMPARFADINLFHPWKRNEYTDMNFIRKQRNSDP